ncbi:transporter, major facilitator family protein [Dictyocaulus viviparus]|uniref:Transporter, major facilitator family protein n=1 Tax=Dictyocaulus viviparus TaxID=29172 RepID=A0A0D8XNM0_DICVI|nr:transporter, major facilitator family protein [Dictyocaulus viviparus]
MMIKFDFSGWGHLWDKPPDLLQLSIGHFYNDLCASMWFTYLMIYLEKVLRIRSSSAGFMMLIGQVTDAISTPLVGIASDSSLLPNFSLKIGRRLTWHMIDEKIFAGTLCVSLSFPFIFNRCFACSDSESEWYKVLWFAPFIMVFQFGWASVQISHLALIPELSSIDSSRTSMNSLRYASTVAANLAVFVVFAWFFSQNTDHTDIGPYDLPHFRTAGFMVLGGGLIMTLLFYLTIREPIHGQRLSRANSLASDTSELVRMHWTSWFGHLQFYQIALLYMTSRLYINVSQVYFPFYITMTQNYTKKYVAILPMVSYISSFVISVINGIPCLNSFINRKFIFLFGISSGISTCIWMLFELTLWQMYFVASLIGITQAILLITSLSITADLINRNTESGAFVYGAMSFVDKLANGVAYQIIELWNPSCDPTQPHKACTNFYRVVMVYVPAGCLMIGLITLFSLISSKIGERIRRRHSKRMLGFFTPISMGLVSGMLSSFLSLLIEKRSRWSSLALHLTNLASETLFRHLNNHGYVCKVKRGEVIPFMIGVGVFSYFHSTGKLDESTRKAFK